MFSLKIRIVYNIISRAKKEGLLHLKGSTGRSKKVMQRVERNILKPFMIVRNPVGLD